MKRGAAKGWAHLGVLAVLDFHRAEESIEEGRRAALVAWAG